MKRALFFLVACCLLSGTLALPASAELTPEREAELRIELDQINKDIAAQQTILDSKKKERVSLERDVSILNANIAAAKLKIRAQTILIERLGKDINQKEGTITQLSGKIDSGRSSLGALVRYTHELSDRSTAELILSGKTLSDFMADADTVETVRVSLKGKIDDIETARTVTSREKETLVVRRDDAADLQANIEKQKKTIEVAEAEKKRLVTLTKNQEKAYQGIIADRQKRKSQIESALFSLRDTEGIPFKDALEYATYASQQTGVRAALILAILTQESNLGKNQGSCYVTNLDTGDGIGKSSGSFFEKVMKAPRDTVPFKQITDAFGRDPSKTPVSCPFGARYSPDRGYGGGMGPSQFIPSTWVLFHDRLRTILGEEPNPWNPKHAITATAMYMGDLGASGGGYSAERNAACKYYSGSICRPGRSPSNVFYGDGVMSKAATIQADIDFVGGNY